jgi:hypothetical protein
VDAEVVAWKIDYADDYMASDVAAMVVVLYGHVDHVERMMGNPCVGGASALVAPTSRLEA